MNELARKDVQQVTVRRMTPKDGPLIIDKYLEQMRQYEAMQKEVMLRNAAERMQSQGLPLWKIRSVLTQMRQEVALC